MPLPKISNIHIHARLIMVVLTTIIVVIASVTFLSIDIKRFQKREIEYIDTLIRILNQTVGPALKNNDKSETFHSLLFLKNENKIINLTLIDLDQNIFSRYLRYDLAHSKVENPLSDKEYIQVKHKLIKIYRSLYYKGEKVGSIYIESDKSNLNQELMYSINLILIIVIASIGLSIFLSRYFQHIVLNPVTDLIQAMKDITERRDYSIKVPSDRTDAIGQLTDEFNRMLKQIHVRDISLQKSLETIHQANEQLKKTQLQLMQAEKLESIGRLAAGIAHEVKNPLAIIEIGTTYLQGKIEKTEESESVVADIIDAVHRADEIIKGLLNFSASHQVMLMADDITKVIDKALVMTKHEITKANIDVTKEYASNIPEIMLDFHRIEQVLINLIMNSIHAMDQGKGELHIKVYVTKVTEPGANIGNRATDFMKVGEEAVVVEIADTGSGIDEETLNKVFDPFFTTKETGLGTGLGLSVSRSILNLHHANIRILNREDVKGARAIIMFKIY